MARASVAMKKRRWTSEFPLSHPEVMTRWLQETYTEITNSQARLKRFTTPAAIAYTLIATIVISAICLAFVLGLR